MTLRYTRDSHWLAGIGVVAFFVRLVYLLQVRNTPLYMGLGLDARFYHRWAESIATGDVLGHGVFFMGPLYPYFLALVYAVSGPDPFHARVVQCAVGACTAIGAALLAREAGGRAAGITAGLLAAFYGPLILFDADILFPVLQVPLVAFSLYFMLRARTSGRGRLWLVSGALLGLAAIGNASVLAFGPVGALWAWLEARRESAGARAGAARTTSTRARAGGTGSSRAGSARNSSPLIGPALYLAGIALAILPVTVRNVAVGHELVFITSNAGLNLYIGNSEESSGAYIKPAGLDVERDPEGRNPVAAAIGRKPSARETSAWWEGRARAFIRANPGRAAALWVKKQALFWGNFEVPQIENFEFQRAFSPLLRLPFPTFGSLLGLAVVGAIVLPRRFGLAGPLILFPLVQSAIIAGFFVVARYRIAVVPAILALAGVGLVAIWRFARARDLRHAGMYASVALAVFALSCWNPYHLRHDSAFGQAHYRQGVELDRAGRLDEAEREYRAAIAFDADYAPARLNLGGILGRTGRAAEAGREFEEAVRIDPDYALAHYNLAAHFEAGGALSKAEEEYRRAAELDPAWTASRAGLARVAYMSGDFDQAGVILAGLAALPPPQTPEEEDPRAEAQYFLGLIARRTELRAAVGDRDDAAWTTLLAADAAQATGSGNMPDSLYAAVASRPGADAVHGVALYELGTRAYARQEFARAESLLREAATLWDHQPNLHFALGNIAVLLDRPGEAIEEFRREIERDPRHAPSWLNLAACYENAVGDFTAARAAYERYVELGGERSAEIRQRLGTLPPANPPGTP